ncbi:MAG TPA: hypothetical protein PLY87_20715, partial [Planctomycetaceae bacterium]|nr:hypothetical protein [Planctomycetaceae bacterium]
HSRIFNFFTASESDGYFVFVVPPSGGNRRSGPCEFRLKAGLQTSNIDKVSAIGQVPPVRCVPGPEPWNED